MADWPCEVCTYLNASQLSLCEMCGTARGAPAPSESAPSSAPQASRDPTTTTSSSDDDFAAAQLQMAEVQRLLSANNRINFEVRL